MNLFIKKLHFKLLLQQSPLVSEQRFDTADITLSLNRDVDPIDLTFQIENKLGNAVVDFPEGAKSGQTQLKELQVSPMGFLLICHEENPQGGLPTTNIILVFSNGKTEVMDFIGYSIVNAPGLLHIRPDKSLVGAFLLVGQGHAEQTGIHQRSHMPDDGIGDGIKPQEFGDFLPAARHLAKFQQT